MIRVFLLVGLLSATAQADVAGASARGWNFELKFGPYTPLIDREASLIGKPYQDTFGSGPMILGELEFERELFQAFGSLGVGISGGYSEKFGKATDATTGTLSSESTGLKIVPLKVMAVYRWDYAAQKHNIPLIPYLKAGVVLIPWWIVKGGSVETADGLQGNGVRYGVAGVVGLALQIDFLDARLARDFDISMGVNHTFLFAEFALQEVNNLGAGGLDLSSRHWMFGMGFEF